MAAGVGVIGDEEPARRRGRGRWRRRCRFWPTVRRSSGDPAVLRAEESRRPPAPVTGGACERSLPIAGVVTAVDLD
ncbi:hypothetical protein E2562_021931 [Oryza meyeriana var. granulata]|uniref:Uncharacterized protein n=1 Tax=Oryza meyeriana var. granulata TaxID=110450 RepID=A0A6G1DLG5_9ORYZ|nr:hypothetical protein E2562_021931 [Oryza meyeriana var. granulata]